MPTPAVPEARGAEREGRADTLQRAVSEINSTLTSYRRHLGIRFHEATNRRIVTVYDTDTNEAVREIPPESVLDAHAHMLELAGLFVDSRG
jgi:flagellar protein FlaG